MENAKGGLMALPAGNGKKTSPGVVRHNLPQIPTVPHSSSRMAVSKASLKECPSPTKPYANLVSMEELEGKNPETPLAKGRSTSNESTPTSGLPTPPSDVTSEMSTKSSHQLSPGNEKTSPPTPIKLKIRRSVQLGGESHLTSSVHLEPEGHVAIPNCVAEHVSKKTSQEKGSKRKSSQHVRGTKSKTNLKGKKINYKQAKEDSSFPVISDSSMELGEVNRKGQEQMNFAGKMKTAVPEITGPPPRWLVGDMVWSKVSGHPWWPCMVAYDPNLGIYIKKKAGFKNANIFHVQFFGEEAERAWVAETAMLSYEGPEKLEAYCKEMLKKDKRKKWIHKISPSRKAGWNISVKSAKEASLLSRAERKLYFTFVYDPPKVKSRKELHEGDLSNGMMHPKSPKQSKRKLTDKDGISSDTLSPTVEPPKKRHKCSSNSSPKGANKFASQGLTQFMVFCQKRRDSVRQQHPNYSDIKIESCLQELWEKLGEDQRSKFIPMGSDVKNLSEMMDSLPQGAKRLPRIPKSSKKKIQVEKQESDFEETEKPLTKKRKKKSAVVKKSAADSTTVEDSVVEGEGTCSLQETSIATVKKRRRLSILNPEGCFTGDNYDELEINRLSNIGPSKKEGICQICEEPGELVSCEGLCQGSFHSGCLGLTTIPAGPFKCDECVTGVHTCFVCKKSSIDTRRCSVAQCGKFFHDGCIVKFPNTRVENKSLYCPLHTCATCAATARDDKNHPRFSKATKGRLYKCIRCPTAYHVGDFCIAAGTIQLAGFNILCSQHFQPVKSQSHHSHINVSWCFMCSKGGTLLCCEGCPASFHAECMGIEFPEGSWYCKDCTNGKSPLYGDIVWVKVGSYRWWPGEICHPKNVPKNIQEKTHQVGEFPVHFFGSHDFFWTHKARVFLFQDGDKGSTESASAKGLAKVFQRAVTEATAAYKLYMKVKEEQEQQEMEKIEKKPPQYKHIKTNYPIGNVQTYKADLSEMPRCECKPDSDAPCGSDTECLNRMLMYECHPAVCPVGEKCQNRRFYKRQYPEVMVVKTDKSGWGLRTLEDIKKGQFVNEYVGDLIDEEECRRRIKKAHENNITNFYMLTLDKNRVIDAGPKGNLSRFMNHSCQPNCETQKWNVNGDVRVGLFAIKDISAGSDLTFNYNLEAIGQEKTICQCGALNCSGFLGVRPKTAAEMSVGNDVKNKNKRDKKKKKRLKHALKVEHEDDCYRCGEGGELVMCDKAECPKAYHLQCLKLTKPPHGKWTCPWHHCDECGKKSVKLCAECPNSFCPSHIQGNIFDTGDGKLICSDHEDILSVLKTKPGGEASIRTPTLESVPSSGSTSPNPSDYESSTTETSDSTVQSSLRNVMGNLEPVESASTTSIPNDSDSSETVLSPKMATSRSVPSFEKQSVGVKTTATKPNITKVSSEVKEVDAKVDVSKSSPNVNEKKKGKAKLKNTSNALKEKGDVKNKGHSSKGRSQGKGLKETQAVALTNNNKEGPMFDDDDDKDEFGDLVIDIPSF